MKKGFTLLEILLVIAAIGVLAAIVIVAINPQRQLAQVRNAERRSELNAIYKAISQYTIDNNGQYPVGIESLSSDDIIEVCASGMSESDCINEGLLYLGDLVPTYIAQIPSDPQVNGNGADYLVNYTLASRVIGLSAQVAELEEEIIIGSATTLNTYGNESTDPGQSCLDILSQNPLNETGNYWIQTASSPIAFEVYCDMSSHDGGWTLISSGQTGEPVKTEGVVLEGSSAYMPVTYIQDLANDGSQIYLRTRSNQSEYIISVPESTPIHNIRNGRSIYINPTQDSPTHWTGTMINTTSLTCNPSTTYLPDFLHSCGNGGGIHMMGTTYYTWTFNGRGTHEDIEVFIR